MTTAVSHAGRTPAAVLDETRAAMIADPGRYHYSFCSDYYRSHRPAIVASLMADGLDHARAYSKADIETKRLVKARTPKIERFAAGDPDLVERFAREELERTRALLAGNHTERRAGLRRLRDWGLLRTTMKEADARHRDRAARRAPRELREEQERIIRDVVPRWEWPASERVAPGLRGLVETNRNGAIHIWTLVADAPMTGAGGRFLESLPSDARIRVFGVSKGGLMEAMLRRRGFAWSRISWHGLRQGEHVSASAWTWLYR